MKDFPYEKWSDRQYNFCWLDLETDSPICVQANKTCYPSSKISNYICAPLSDFSLIGTSRVGREIFEESRKDAFKLRKVKLPKLAPRDPIILMPVKASELNEVGFIVVTKWGIESNDTELQVGINN